MAAYRRVYDSRHLQADCQEQRSAPESYVWATFIIFLLHGEERGGVGSVVESKTSWKRTVADDVVDKYGERFLG